MSAPRELRPYEAESWARAFPARTIYHKAVLMVLAERADGHGECWPSQARIADDLGISERKVRDVLAELTDTGTIERERRPRTDGRGRSSDLIRLIIPAGWDQDQPAQRAGRSDDQPARIDDQPAQNGRPTGTLVPGNRQERTYRKALGNGFSDDEPAAHLGERSAEADQEHRTALADVRGLLRAEREANR